MSHLTKFRHVSPPALALLREPVRYSRALQEEVMPGFRSSEDIEPERSKVQMRFLEHG
jgi:hypothetical protein